MEGGSYRVRRREIKKAGRKRNFHVNEENPDELDKQTKGN